LEATLNSEITTLGYPKAALFAFCVALVSYNFLSAHLGSIIFELSKYHMLFLNSRLHNAPSDVALNPELIF
jgi:hypothetical protein